jgi:thiol-disulfide isomerase/thioredoxin
MKRRVVFLAAVLATAFQGLLFSDAASAADAPKDKDRVVVMYFHRTQRCPTCQKMGSYTEEAVKKGFAREIKEGKVDFHFIDFQDAKNAAFTKAYGIQGPTLIVAKASGTKVSEYQNLDEMWTKVRDKADFIEYVQTSVKSYLKDKAKTAKR